jgi:hypothetical protein
MAMMYLARIKELDIEQDFNDSVIRFYCLEDGYRIVMPSIIAWCENCKAVVKAEQVPDDSLIEARIDQVESGSLDEFLRLDDQKRVKEIEYHKRVLAWRKSRISPAKCLVCGSSEFTELVEPEGYPPTYPPGVTHVNFGGRNVKLELFLSGHFNSRGGNELNYDPEGNRV